MNQNQYLKWVQLSYVGLAALISYIVFEAATFLGAQYDLEARIRHFQLGTRIGSVAIGAIVFLVLLRHAKINQFMSEVAVEFSRVTWPTQKDTQGATVVVLIMVLISGLFLGLVDYLWTRAFNLLF